MENPDASGSSTAVSTLQDFLERMRQPSASDFVKSIKSFIVSFLNNTPDAERDSTAVQEFLSNMEAAFRAHSLWAGSSEEELESACEGLEKYVMTKLFSRSFASTPEDIEADENLYRKISLVQQFLRPEHLDISPTYQNEASWLLAQKELQKINMSKPPRDKLQCILNCCRVINNLLLKASMSSNGDHPGADEFLPVLIYVTIKANPPQLHSNLVYIQRFRRQSRLVSEAAYFFTNMVSAESFITNLDAKSLSMDEEEFEKNMESGQALLSGLLESSTDNLTTTDTIELKVDSTSKKHHPMLASVSEKGARELLKQDAAASSLDFPYLYCEAGDLSIGDVEDLLNKYKQLVLNYVCLARGLEVSSTADSSNQSRESNALLPDETGTPQ